MKKTAVVFAVILFSMAVFLPLTVDNQAVNAQTSYSIDSVAHNIKLLSSGHMVISDTIQLSGQSPSAFQMGFPYKYGQYVREAVAYDSSGKELPITLGVELQGQSGFYGVSVDLTGTSSQSFTVAFTLSNALLTSTNTGFTFDFPAYPSFTQTAAQCIVNIATPTYASITGIDKPDGVVNASSHQKSGLAAFTYAPASGIIT